MGERFDGISRTLGTSVNRRHALKVMGGAVGAALAATVLRPFRAEAACATGTTKCGTACCSNSSEVCSQGKSSCCCPKSSTPCGPACCAAGVACVNSNKGICGCPAGHTQCVSGGVVTCCPAGKACTSGCATAQSLGSTVKTCTTSCGCTTSNDTTCRGTDVSCPDIPSCYCWKRADGGEPFCGSNATTSNCNTDAECGGGLVCVVCDPAGSGTCPGCAATGRACSTPCICV